MNPPRHITAVLFDLDGTLIDTGPDLANAMNTTLEQYQRNTVDYAGFRYSIYAGTASMIQFAFGITDKDPDFTPIRDTFLQHYREQLSKKSRLFDGVNTLLDFLNTKQLPWGIVTNKPGWLAEPLVSEFDELQHSQCLICGDTYPQRKPHPLPLLKACESMNHQPSNVAYVGDTEGDAQAANAANMLSISVSYGYAPKGSDLNAWTTDHIVPNAEEIISYLNLAESR